MLGEIITGVPKQARELLLHDPQMQPINLLTDDVRIDSRSGAVICEQRIHLADWASPGTIALRVYPDNSSLYGYPEVGHEPGKFFTLDEKQQPHEYTVGQIFPFNPQELPVDRRPADILDLKFTGRLVMEIEWDHDPYGNDEKWRDELETKQTVDSRIGKLPIAIKIGRVILMAMPDQETLIMQQGYKEYTLYEKFILFGKTDYFTAEPDAPEPAGYVGAEVILPLDLDLLKSTQLLFLNTRLAPVLSKRTSMGLPPAVFIQEIAKTSYRPTPQLPMNNV